MKFVQGPDGWHLVVTDDAGDACVVATLRSELEVLAVKAYCEMYLKDPSTLPVEFHIRHDRKTYTVTCPAKRGEKLALRVVGEDGSNVCIKTEFVL